MIIEFDNKYRNRFSPNYYNTFYEVKKALYDLTDIEKEYPIVASSEWEHIRNYFYRNLFTPIWDAIFQPVHMLFLVYFEARFNNDN